MKSTLVVFLFSTFALFASNISAAPCGSDNCAANQIKFSAIRQYTAIGTKNWRRGVFDRPSKGWFSSEWNKVMATVVKDHSCALKEHYPALATKFRWSEAYIDSQIKPTRSQARDPNWSNYVWNHPENGDGFVYDGITDALKDPLINNGNGIAKLAVIVTLTSTAGNLNPPQWMRNDKSLTWLEGVNTNGRADNWHVRFDNPQAVDHAADFLAAFLAKYGNNKGLHSINLGEYYFGHKKYWPSGLNRNKYLVGIKNLWGKVVQAAPLDENGQRINIVQTNPLFNTDVTLNDLEALGIGISESDTRLDFVLDDTLVTADMRKLYDKKKVHVMINGDERYACQSRRQSWDGTPNPFGHKKGFSGVATPQELFWYHSEKGPVPTHSFFMTIAYWCHGPQTRENFINAIKRFGRCGTEATKWGVAPATFSNRNIATSIPLSKPKPPIVVIK